MKGIWGKNKILWILDSFLLLVGSCSLACYHHLWNRISPSDSDLGSFSPKVASSCGRLLTSWCELCIIDDWSSLWPEAFQGSLSHGHCLWLNTSHRPAPKGSAPSGCGALTFFSSNKEVPPGASVQFSCSVMSDSVIPWTAARQASLSITNSWSLLKRMSIELVMPCSHLILCCPLLLLPSIFPSVRVFSDESALCIRWPKYWSFSFNISPSNEYSGLISFRMDWFDLLAVQGTLKSLLQHHSSKASILQHSAFFMVQLSYPYMTTGKT